LTRKRVEEAKLRQVEMVESKKQREDQRKNSLEAKIDNLRNESKSRDRMRLEANKRFKTVK